ncbi:MAG: hypothetical protein R6V03_03135 [Kiritimatiellia bacterium]
MTGAGEKKRKNDPGATQSAAGPGVHALNSAGPRRDAFGTQRAAGDWTMPNGDPPSVMLWGEDEDGGRDYGVNRTGS